jgi:hypothetical protein
MVVGRRIDCEGLLLDLPSQAQKTFPAYIFRLLHSAQACGVVILLAAPVPLALGLSCESVDAFRGVTPWKVWNMPPCVGTGIVGAICDEGFVVEGYRIRSIPQELGASPQVEAGS